MLKKEIEFTGHDGQPRREVWSFHLSKTDIVNMGMSFQGEDFSTYLQQIVDSKDGKAMIENFNKFLMLSVGKQVGDRFIKNQDIVDEFVETGAYDAIYMNLLTNAGFAADFINNVIPRDLAEEIAAAKEKKHDKAELLAMSDDEFHKTVSQAYGPNEMDWPKDVLLMAFKRKNVRAA